MVAYLATCKEQVLLIFWRDAFTFITQNMHGKMALRSIKAIIIMNPPSSIM